MIVVEFKGDQSEIAAAEDWCDRLTEWRWVVQDAGNDRYEFVFEHPFDAQSFRQRHRANTSLA